MTIQILTQSAHQALPVDGPVPKPLTDPTCVQSNLRIQLDGAGENRTGIWEVSVGRFVRQMVNAEVMHILAGECTFTPDGGETSDIRAGDTLYFPANTDGVWDVRVPLRKVYVVLA